MMPMKNNVIQNTSCTRPGMWAWLCAFSFFFASQASASFYSYATTPGQLASNCPSSCNTQNLPVSAKATFDIQAGQMIVTLTNLESNITSVGQNISSLFFTVNNSSSVLDLSKANVTLSASLVTITSKTNSYSAGTLNNVPVTSTASSSTHWTTYGYQPNGTTPLTQNQMGLNDLNGGGQPDQTIIGPGPYNTVNSSIYGNGPHNPFIQQTATFTIAAAGLLPTSKVTSVQIGFGTAPNCNIMHTVPEPGALPLFAIGAAAIGAARRKPRRRLA